MEELPLAQNMLQTLFVDLAGILNLTPVQCQLKLICTPTISAGFGELSKYESNIKREFGSIFRLSAVLTNCLLTLSHTQKHRIEGFCTNCRICETAFPQNPFFWKRN